MDRIFWGANGKLGSLEHPTGQPLSSELLGSSEHGVLKSVAVRPDYLPHVVQRWLGHFWVWSPCNSTSELTGRGEYQQRMKATNKLRSARHALRSNDVLGAVGRFLVFS